MSDPSLATLAVTPPPMDAVPKRWPRRTWLAVAGITIAVGAAMALSLPHPDAGRGATHAAPPAAAAPPTPTPAATAAMPDSAAATLVVDARPPATVLLDGRPLGTTPVLHAQVPPGEHRVRLEAKGYQPYERTVDLIAGGADSLIHITLTRAR